MTAAPPRDRLQNVLRAQGPRPTERGIGALDIRNDRVHLCGGSQRIGQHIVGERGGQFHFQQAVTGAQGANSQDKDQGGHPSTPPPAVFW